jgi:hypothetical protein
MEKVTVKKEELLEKLKANREAHKELFSKAQKVYRQDMIEELDRMLAEAKAGKQIRRAITMPEPQDHTADYNRVIAMVEMSVSPFVELYADDFDKYVMDNWSWSAHALATNTMYATKAGLLRQQ